VWADADADGDVDADDFGKFQLCYTGSDPEATMPSDPKCKCFDRPAPTTDNHVDNSDLIEFDKCATGADVPWSPSNPGPPCAP
jgi:hypothetical protein